MSSPKLPTPTEVSKLAALREDLLFMPNPAHRRAKCQFWARYGGLGKVNPSQAQVLEITKEPGIAKWWSLPGFKEWFFNQDEARERLEYLYMLALDSAEELLLNPNSNDNAKVQAIKVIANLAGKEPSKNESYIDAEIQRMDSAKLKAYIEKHTRQLEPAKEVDNTDGDRRED